MNRPSISEFVIGLVVVFAFLPWFYSLGVLAVLIIGAFSASLWALGGSLNKAYRRIGVPVMIVGVSVIAAVHPWSIFGVLAALLTMIVAASIGYGSASTQPYDPGSTLFRFWFDKMKLMHDPAELMTRFTVGLAFGSAGIFLGGPLWWWPMLTCSLGFAFVWSEIDR